MTIDPKEAARLYSEGGWSLARIASTYRASHETVRRVIESEGIEIRGRGRPRIPEAEWVRRKALGLESLTWEEYGRKIGVPVWANPSLDRNHGVRLGCRECVRKGRKPPRPSTRHLSIGIGGRISVCSTCYRSLRRGSTGVKGR